MHDISPWRRRITATVPAEVASLSTYCTLHYYLWLDLVIWSPASRCWNEHMQNKLVDQEKEWT